MTSFLEGIYRTVRYGKAIIVVSGLPRSGTSMTMKMLGAGGVQALTDGLRTADESNPKGYFEFEPVKNLHRDTDTSWLTQARGKAIKIISFLLPNLPEAHNYKVIFMHRSLHEVIVSQNKMLAQRGEATGEEDDDQILKAYESHLDKTTHLLARRSCFQVLDVRYKSVIDSPAIESERIRAFLGGGLDVERMAAAVDNQLYRNRRE